MTSWDSACTSQRRSVPGAGLDGSASVFERRGSCRSRRSCNFPCSWERIRPDPDDDLAAAFGKRHISAFFNVDDTVHAIHVGSPARYHTARRRTGQDPRMTRLRHTIFSTWGPELAHKCEYAPEGFSAVEPHQFAYHDGGLYAAGLFRCGTDIAPGFVLAVVPYVKRIRWTLYGSLSKRLCHSLSVRTTDRFLSLMNSGYIFYCLPLRAVRHHAHPARLGELPERGGRDAVVFRRHVEFISGISGNRRVKTDKGMRIHNRSQRVTFRSLRSRKYALCISFTPFFRERGDAADAAHLHCVAVEGHFVGGIRSKQEHILPVVADRRTPVR